MIPYTGRSTPHNGGMDGYHDRPLVAQALTGIRQWRLSHAQGLLLSAVYPYTWGPQTNTAHCDASVKIIGHRILHPDCGCGFWAQTSATHARFFGRHDTTDLAVTGTVAAWGSAVAGPRGFRAEHARITGVIAVPISTPRSVTRRITAADVRAIVRAHYPDATVHGTQAELLEAHPLSDLTHLLTPED